MTMRWLSMSATRRRRDLGDPQAGGIGGHENGAVLEVFDGGEEAEHFVGAEDDREGTRLLDGQTMLSEHVVAAEGDPVEESQGGPESACSSCRETCRS